MKGKVIKSTGNTYKVKIKSGKILNAKLKGSFKIKGIQTTNPIAVGDWIELDYTFDNYCIIHTILPRDNYIIRKSTKLSKQSHIIASNIDQLFIITSIIEPRVKLGFIDRMLVTAEIYQIPVVIVFNKYDLYFKNENLILKELIKTYNKIGYECIISSTKLNLGIDEIKHKLNNKTTLLSGQSGVGKSSIINCINPEIKLKTSENSKFNDKGKHTTTFAEMYTLSEHIEIIDTPGIKNFGMVNFTIQDLLISFKEIYKYSVHCKFADCTHTKEPNCNVIKKVESADIKEWRYQNYKNLFQEITLK